MQPHVQQRVVQLQRVNVRDGSMNDLISMNSPNSQLAQHPSPQGALQPPLTPVTPRPPSSATPGTPSPLQTPTTPHPQDISTPSPVSNDMQGQLPVITPPPPPPYPGPPPPYPSQLKVSARWCLPRCLRETILLTFRFGVQHQLVPQQMHHLSGSSTPNVVAVSSGSPIGKLVHHQQLPSNVPQMARRPLLLQVSIC